MRRIKKKELREEVDYDYLGIDVSKKELYVYDGDKVYVMDNKSYLTRLKNFINKMGYDKKKLVISYEPTGVYSNNLENFCARNKIKVFRADPYRASYFAKSTRGRNKNDAIDSINLYKMAQVYREEVRELKLKKRSNDLNNLMRYYRITIKEINRWNNRLKSYKHLKGEEKEFLLRKAKSNLNRYKKEKDMIFNKAKEYVKKDKLMYKKYKELQKISGIGEKVAMILLGFFIKYEDANRDQIVSLSGLDAVERSSGSSVRRRRRISKKGDRIVRQFLFLSALTAIRYNEQIYSFYSRLLKNNKPKMLSVVASMRKLLVIAFHNYKSVNQNVAA